MKEEDLWLETPEWKEQRSRWLALFNRDTNKTTSIPVRDVTLSSGSSQVIDDVVHLDNYNRYNRVMSWNTLTSDSKKKLESLVIITAGYGMCHDCNTAPSWQRQKPVKLHKSNLTQASDGFGRCHAHIRKAILNTLRYDRYQLTQDDWDYWGNGQDYYEPTELFEWLLSPNAIILPIHQEQREVCPACNGYFLLPTDDAYLKEWSEVQASVGATWNPEQTKSLHSCCTHKCADNDCNVRFYSNSGLQEVDSFRYCEQHFTEYLESQGVDPDGISPCEYCNAYSTKEELQYSDMRCRYLCSECYDGEWECNECSSTMYGEDEDHYCEESDDDRSSDYINSYGYKPRAIFYGKDDRIFMGFELEVETTDDDWSTREYGAELVLELNEKRYYLKEDGSLSNGFEVVTHPHTLKEYQTKLDWDFLNILRRKGFVSWNSSNCGLHVHIGLSAFVNMAHEARFTKFIYDNQRQVEVIAGRSSGYAAFSDKGKAVDKIKYKNSKSWDRYQAVNNLNSNTLEVRVFKGSLRKERVLSAIEFIHAVCEYTRTLKANTKDKPFGWAKFVAYVANNADTYPNFFTILNESFAKAVKDQEREEEMV